MYMEVGYEVKSNFASIWEDLEMKGDSAKLFTGVKLRWV